MPTWSDILFSSLTNLWGQFVGWAPNFILALVVFVVGLIIATGIGKLIESVIDALKIDSLIEKAGVKPFFDRAGLKLDSGRFIGQLVFWFVTLAFLLAATDILKLSAVSDAIARLLAYVPNVVVAAIVLLAAVILANFLQKVVRSMAAGGNLDAANMASAVVRWAVLIFGFLAAINQLGVEQNIINILLTGFVAMTAIAGGLAFGLGGKDYAAHLLEKFRKQVED